MRYLIDFSGMSLLSRPSPIAMRSALCHGVLFYHAKPSFDISYCETYNGARNLISVIIIGIYLKIIHHKIIVNPPVIFGAVCYAGVFLMNSFEKSDSLSSIFIGQALSAATCIWFVFGESDFGATAMCCILALGIFQLAFAYIFMVKGLDEVPAVTASLTMAIEPVLNPILVAVF